MQRTDDTERHAGLSRMLYEEFRARVADGTYPAGAALPSTRLLAAERGISRATVTLVYEQLAADGFIETRKGAASRVAAGAASQRRSNKVRMAGAVSSVPAGQLSAIGHRITAMGLVNPAPVATGEIDFVYGPLSGTDFPTVTWMKARRTVEQHRSRRLEYEDPRGNLELRKSLQTHLSQMRGLACSVEQIMIVNGSQQAIDLCARLLVDPGDSVAVENPGYRAAQHAFEAYGAKLQFLEIDDHGVITDQLGALGATKLAFVTPTHQFPLGSFLPIARRRQLLTWAAQRRAWIIEDDYDSEYRYAVHPELTLQSLDTRGCVIHVGTFSKTLSPQLRLGYLVLPTGLIETFSAAKRLTDRHTSTGAQRALAHLLEDGTYDRHVRRIRRLQHARQKALLDALERHLGGRIEVSGAASGLHIVVWFRSLLPRDEPALAEAARRRGVRVHPITPLFHPQAERTAPWCLGGLVMGYALLDSDAIEEGVKKLAAALLEVERVKEADRMKKRR